MRRRERDVDVSISVSFWRRLFGMGTFFKARSSNKQAADLSGQLRKEEEEGRNCFCCCSMVPFVAHESERASEHHVNPIDHQKEHNKRNEREERRVFRICHLFPIDCRGTTFRGGGEEMKGCQEIFHHYTETFRSFVKENVAAYFERHRKIWVH